MITEKLKAAWAELNNVDKLLDRCEMAVNKINERPQAKGRETPFWGQKQFLFARGDTQYLESPLIHSAGSVTRVVRLTASVQEQLARGASSPGLNDFARASLRPTCRAGWGTFDYNDGAQFDFEWSYRIESTQRQYASAQINADGINWLASKSLGNPEMGSQLLFNPKHPLVLKTNEFLTLQVKAITTDFQTSAINTEDRFVVNLTYSGYRTFGYDS